MWAFGGWARSSCNILYPRWHHVRCRWVLVARHKTYLSSHLCLRVCALSSPFVPYHGVLIRGGGSCVASRGQTCSLCSHSLTRVGGL